MVTNNSLPSGWVRTSVGELYDIVGGGTPSTTVAEYWDGDIPWITSADIHGVDDIRPRKYVTKSGIENSATNLVPASSLIVVTRVGLGKIGITKTDMCFSQDSQALVGENSLILPSYSLYYLSEAVQIFKYRSRGTTIAGVTKKQLSELPFYLPPLPEQHRIVAKIEELITRLDAGVEALNKIKLQLKRYRHSVLKSAFNGELTAEWRKAHKGELEPASVLLEKIKLERKKSGKYKELPPLDASDLPELPEGWAWTTIQYLAENNKHAIKAGPFGSSLKKEFYTPSGYKIYGQEQVIRGDSSYGDYYIDKERFDKLKSCSVEPGDVLISLVGTIGKVLVLPETIEPGIINPRLVKLSLEKKLISNIYIKAYIDSSTSRQFFSLSSHGGTMDILNLSILKTLPIPLPSINEQKIIVEEIDRCFSIADEIENIIERSLKQSERLRQSILKRAFAGKLVPQDPSDEPAEKLLERIKAERAGQQSIKKQGRLVYQNPPSNWANLNFSG